MGGRIVLFVYEKVRSYCLDDLIHNWVGSVPTRMSSWILVRMICYVLGMTSRDPQKLDVQNPLCKTRETITTGSSLILSAGCEKIIHSGPISVTESNSSAEFVTPRYSLSQFRSYYEI
ncbi:hypothetical protein AAE478_009986 [Parahypoxylon ruwenzoriense]